jgi:hypothetical protein
MIKIKIHENKKLKAKKEILKEGNWSLSSNSWLPVVSEALDYNLDYQKFTQTLKETNFNWKVAFYTRVFPDRLDGYREVSMNTPFILDVRQGVDYLADLGIIDLKDRETNTKINPILSVDKVFVSAHKAKEAETAPATTNVEIPYYMDELNVLRNTNTIVQIRFFSTEPEAHIIIQSEYGDDWKMYKMDMW